MNNNANINATGDAKSYVDALNEMIQINNKLELSFKKVADSVPLMDDALIDITKKSKQSKNTLDSISKNIIKNNVKDYNKEINSILNKTTGSILNNINSSNAFGSTAKNIINTLGKNITDTKSIDKIMQQFNSITSKGKDISTIGNAGKTAMDAAAVSSGKAATGIKGVSSAAVGASTAIAGVSLALLALVAITLKLNKMGKSGRDTTMSLTRSYKELGDTADYVLAYAAKLTDDLGQSMDVTLNKVSAVARELRSVGMFSKQATEAAINVEGLSLNIAAAWGIDNVDDVREQFMNALSGGGGLEYTGAFTSDKAMAGWLSSTKGINMYSTAISDAQMKAYRLEKIVDDLNKVTLTTGESLVNMNINLDSTWARNQKIANQLETTRKQWEALMVPIYNVGVAIKSWVVDGLFNASNAILRLFGKEELSLSSDVLIDNKAIQSVYDLNAAYSKTGDEIKQVKDGLTSFDELLVSGSIQTLDPGASMDFANNAELTGLGVNLDTAMEKGVEKSKELKRNIVDMDIQLANSSKKLKNIWDSLTEEERKERWVDMAIRYSQLGEELPPWLKTYDDGKYYETWMSIDAALKSGDRETLDRLLEELNNDGIHSFDTLIDVAIKAMDGGYQGSLQELLAKEEKKRTFKLTIDILKGWLLGTLIGGLLFGPIGATVGGFIALAFNSEEIKQVWSNLTSDLKDKVYRALDGARTWFGGIMDGVTNRLSNLYNSASGFASNTWGAVKTGASNIYGKLTGMATGGVAVTPNVVKIAENYPEIVQPLDGPLAQQFYRNIADVLKTTDTVSGSPTSINVSIPVSNMIATNYELKQLSEILADHLAEALRNRGVLDAGVII